MNVPKNMESLQDEEYQLTFLLDRPLVGTAKAAPRRGSPIPAEVAEHVLHLPPADDLGSRT